MRRLGILVLALLLWAGPAPAFQCPLLIKQVRDHIAKMSADDAKVKQAKALLDEAQRLHAEAGHAKSIAKVDEAAKLLGIELKRN